MPAFLLGRIHSLVPPYGGEDRRLPHTHVLAHNQKKEVVRSSRENPSPPPPTHQPPASPHLSFNIRNIIYTHDDCNRASWNPNYDFTYYHSHNELTSSILPYLQIKNKASNRAAEGATNLMYPSEHMNPTNFQQHLLAQRPSPPDSCSYHATNSSPTYIPLIDSNLPPHCTKSI